MSGDDFEEDVVCSLPNPWIMWAKLGARVQKFYDSLQSQYIEMQEFARNPDGIELEDLGFNQTRMRLMEDLIDEYDKLFDDITTNGIASDDKT